MRELENKKILLELKKMTERENIVGTIENKEENNAGTKDNEREILQELYRKRE